MDAPEMTNRTERRDKRSWHILPLLVGTALLVFLSLKAHSISKAAPVLDITPVTWNVVGLDAGDVNAGPNKYLSGARVCNKGNENATDVTANFGWTSDQALINLVGPASLSASTLSPNACVDFYFHIEITPDTNALGGARKFVITAEADGVAPVSTPGLHEIYVKGLIAKGEDMVVSITGPNLVVVGQTYTYTVQSQIPLDNFEQLVHFLDLPNTLFQVETVKANYTQPLNAENDAIYNDACGWNNVPGSSTYLSCTSEGQVGGLLTLEYRVKILDAGSATVPFQVYGFFDGNYQYYPAGAGSSIIISSIVQTPTPTFTPSPTSAVTDTPTVTGTPPTPTPTGTLTPDPRITNAVNPNQARVGQNLTFTIRASNDGAAQAADVSIRTTFSTFLDIVSATPTKGSAVINAQTRTVTITVGTLNPREVITVSIVTRVNNTVRTTTTLSHVASLSYSVNSTEFTRTSNTVIFTVLPAATLPGTGQPIGDVDGRQFEPGFLLAGLGIFGFGSGLWVNRRRLSRIAWLVIIAVVWIFLAILWIKYLGREPNQLVDAGGTQMARASETSRVERALSDFDPAWELPIPLPAGTLETLPDYPIPSPTVEVAPGEEDSVDITPVTRIVIPDLAVDTVVKYVPYDGLTWLIAGLRDEVAWMGDTSWPGLGGNTALAGHATIRGLGVGPFYDLASLKDGARVVLYTQKGRYTYQVREKVVVEETDMSVVEQTQNAQITLITCTDWNPDMEIYLKRYVVFADLVETEHLSGEMAGN